MFSYLLDTTRVNVQTLVSVNLGKDPRKVNSFDFGHKLAMELITPYLYNRELTNVQQNIVLKMHLATSDDRFLGHVMRVGDRSQAAVEGLPFRGQLAKTGKRCGECMRDIYSTGHNKKDKRKKINGLSKPTTRCEKCGLVKCNKKHLMKLCATCISEWGQ